MKDLCKCFVTFSNSFIHDLRPKIFASLNLLSDYFALQSFAFHHFCLRTLLPHFVSGHFVYRHFYLPNFFPSTRLPSDFLYPHSTFENYYNRRTFLHPQSFPSGHLCLPTFYLWTLLPSLSFNLPGAQWKILAKTCHSMFFTQRLIFQPFAIRISSFLDF